jgi:hypothetical protein
MKVIQGSSNINHLTFDRCNLTEHTVRSLAKLPNLQALHIDQDKMLTDSDLEPLSLCSHIGRMTLDCKRITPKIVNSLYKMRLYELNVPFDDATCSQLSSMLHGTKVSPATGNGMMRESTDMKDIMLKYSNQ